MILGLTLEKVLVIAVIAGILVGPERIPRYAERLAVWTGRAREFIRSGKARMKDEMGSDFDDVDWRKLDPRQYDPRRIIREALLDDAPPARVVPPVATAPAAPAAPAPRSTPTFSTEGRPPFDAEAT